MNMKKVNVNTNTKEVNVEQSLFSTRIVKVSNV